jgi:hypothetical protein
MKGRGGDMEKIIQMFHWKWRGVNWGVNNTNIILNFRRKRPLHFLWNIWSIKKIFNLARP